MGKNKENKVKQEEIRDPHYNEPAPGKQENGENQPDEQGKPAEEPSEVEILQKKYDEVNDKYLRLQAEFDNFRRRTSKEKLELVAVASKDVVVGLLPTLDDCERALDALKKSDAAASAIEGTELIYNKLFNFLKSKGLERIEAAGKDFDTDFHEAIAQIPAQEPKDKNKVLDVVQQGYTLNGTIVRFAKVVVGV